MRRQLDVSSPLAHSPQCRKKFHPCYRFAGTEKDKNRARELLSKHEAELSTEQKQVPVSLCSHQNGLWKHHSSWWRSAHKPSADFWPALLHGPKTALFPTSSLSIPSPNLPKPPQTSTTTCKANLFSPALARTLAMDSTPPNPPPLSPPPAREPQRPAAPAPAAPRRPWSPGPRLNRRSPEAARGRRAVSAARGFGGGEVLRARDSLAREGPFGPKREL